MKMDKKARVLTICIMAAALGTFSTTKTKDTSLYSESTEQLKLESVQMMDNLKISEDAKLQAIEEKNRTLAVNAPSKTIDKPSLSRGGNGLSTSKPKVQPTSKTQVDTSSSSRNSDRDLFSRLVSAEAGSESLEGQLAVATVIMNRVKSNNYPNTIQGVIMDKAWGYQFTPVLDGRINLPATASAKKAVDMIMSGYRSFGDNIFYFINPKKAASPWIINNRTYFKSIGNHDFYY